MDPLERRLQIAEVAGTWLAAIAVVVGGLFGVFQYLEHKAGVRVDRTMAFVERYHSDGLLMEARLQITQSITTHVDRVNNILRDADTEPQDLAKSYYLSINKIVEQEALAGPLEQVFTFYEQIILCRELALCDQRVAEQFFDTDARTFLRTYYPYVCAVRTKLNNPNLYARVVDFYFNNGSQSLCDM
jgi:hypothetical protein